MARKSTRKNIIGRRLAEGRLHSTPTLTQDALSGRLARIGIQLDRAAIAKIESNRRRVFDYEVKGIAEVLQVDPGWLLGGKPR